MITPQLLAKALRCPADLAERYAAPLADACRVYGINTAARSLNVSPRQTGLDSPDLRLRDADGFGNLALGQFAIHKQPPDKHNLLVEQFRGVNCDAASQFFRPRTRAIPIPSGPGLGERVKRLYGMPDVLSVREVLKICKAVVFLVAVLVVNRRARRSRANEGFANKFVHKERALPAFERKTHIQVAMMIRRRSQLAWRRVVVVTSAHDTVRGHLIDALVSNHTAPFDHAFIVAGESR